MTIAFRDQLERRADYTHKHNLKTGRHGWLRLTPAYSVKIVEELIRPHRQPRCIYDPFCGTGTTALSAAYHGHSAITSDINPFLVWLATAKTAVYTRATIIRTRTLAGLVSSLIRKDEVATTPAPPIHNIKRWWSNNSIDYLCKLRTAIALVSDENTPERTLLEVSFCRTLMQLSNAAFNHQSMSFKDESNSGHLHFSEMKDVFVDNVRYVSEGAAHNPNGGAEIVLGDARDASGIIKSGVDVVITSPPYANRMSYIRELRPYMYWLGFLSKGRDAGELDWSAIGGTWGVATSRLNDWRRADDAFANVRLEEILRQVSDEKNPNGILLANYIARYHDDIWLHLQSLIPLLHKGSEVNYIVGNSTFYGVLLPVEVFYAEMLSQLGFVNVQCIPLRKRNSKKELIEFNVRADFGMNAMAKGTSKSRRRSQKKGAKNQEATIKKSETASKKANGAASPSHLIDARIAALGDWRGTALARVRALIKQADPEVVEEWKWRGVPVWEHEGIICTGETYKAFVKLTFAKGAALQDPSGLFNSSLEGNVRRAIDIREGDKIDEKALKALIRAAVALNTAKRAAARPVRSRKRPKI